MPTNSSPKENAPVFETEALNAGFPSDQTKENAMTHDNDMQPILQDTMAWNSDNMEPAIEFGDEIRVIPTGGRIKADGMYLLEIDRSKIEPAAMRKLCAPVVRVVWRAERLEDGRIALTCDNPGYHAMNDVVEEAELLMRWRVAGRVVVTERNGRGFGGFIAQQAADFGMGVAA